MLSPAFILRLQKLGLITPGQSLQPDDRAVCAFHADAPDTPVGVLILRPALYVHTLNILEPPGVSRRAIADRLFAQGELTARALGSPGTLFHIHRANVRMQRWVESHGAICEPDSLLYRYDLPLHEVPHA